MKKLVFVALAATMVASSWAQGTFTIRRPSDGARVRETVAVRIPKNSIPEGGYIGIVVNGKFLEAVLPGVEGDDYVYYLDTKKRALPDGPLTIETILYRYTESNPQVLNRSSVTVNLDNVTSIKIPSDGLKLRYSFPSGRESSYTVSRTATISTVSQAQAQLGSRGREIQLEEENYRFLWAVDNRYSDGDGLIRIQALPKKGKDYTFITPAGSTEPRLTFETEMQPLFHRITSTGREKFTSLPTYFPMEGTAGESFTSDFILVYPIPVLPTKGIKPGDIWQATFNLSTFEIEERHEEEKAYQPSPARGVFEGVEWQNGIPCAKISQTLQLGAADLRNARNVNNLPGEAQTIKLVQLIWFGLDRGQVVRQEINVEQESLVETAAQGGGGGGPAGLGRPGAAAGPADAGSGFGPGDIGGRFNFRGLVPPSYSEKAWSMLQAQPGRPGGGPGGLGRPGGPPGAPGAPGGDFGRGGAGAGTGSVGVKVIQRFTSRIIFELEK